MDHDAVGGARAVMSRLPLPSIRFHAHLWGGGNPRGSGFLPRHEVVAHGQDVTFGRPASRVSRWYEGQQAPVAARRG
jgi:hypothetical protein